MHQVPDDSAQELRLGDSWESNPLVWRNFVSKVIHKHGLHSPDQIVWPYLEMELSKYNLTVDMTAVSGSPEDLIAWQLTYG